MFVKFPAIINSFIDEIINAIDSFELRTLFPLKLRGTPGDDEDGEKKPGFVRLVPGSVGLWAASIAAWKGRCEGGGRKVPPKTYGSDLSNVWQKSVHDT